MILLYTIRVDRLSRKRVVVTLAPNHLGRLLRRRVRRGVAYRDRDRDGDIGWWWEATDRYVGVAVERCIETVPVIEIEDMTVDELLIGDGGER